ncbi:hypothetical protein KEM52_000934, partial [Ascosphaera acerosa]
HRFPNLYKEKFPPQLRSADVVDNLESFNDIIDAMTTAPYTNHRTAAATATSRDGSAMPTLSPIVITDARLSDTLDIERIDIACMKADPVARLTYDFNETMIDNQRRQWYFGLEHPRCRNLKAVVNGATAGFITVVYPERSYEPCYEDVDMYEALEDGLEMMKPANPKLFEAYYINMLENQRRLSLKLRKAVITNMAVHPEYRGLGCEALLLERTIEIVQKRGLPMIWVEVATGLTQVYEDFGFMVVIKEEIDLSKYGGEGIADLTAMNMLL